MPARCTLGQALRVKVWLSHVVSWYPVLFNFFLKTEGGVSLGQA
jgi:hypothetical protein